MSIYRGIIEFADGRKFDDIWVNKEDAMSYFEQSPYYDGCIRAELFEMVPGEGVHYENKVCLYEYDVNGHYYYDVKEVA